MPSYDSKILLKTPAGFLLHNLSGDSHQPITQVAKIQAAMKKAGCGKTRTCYEL